MRVLLLGHPVGHSLSPVIQNAAFAALGMAHEYVAEDTIAGDLAARIAGLRDGTHLGANVTIPHKVGAVAAVDSGDEDVSRLGALNTIVARGGRLEGHNTDVAGAWEGLLKPVRAHIAGARVALLGAGGGARAVMLALARCGRRGPTEVLVVGRRPGAAAEVAALGAAFGLSTRALAWDDRGQAVAAAGVLVNCTPLGLAGEDPLAGFELDARVVLDLAYRPGGTPLYRRARRTATAAIQGDEMLLHQGAAAFRWWTGEEAPLAAMRDALRRALDG